MRVGFRKDVFQTRTERLRANIQAFRSLGEPESLREKVRQSCFCRGESEEGLKGVLSRKRRTLWIGDEDHRRDRSRPEKHTRSGDRRNHHRQRTTS